MKNQYLKGFLCLFVSLVSFQLSAQKIHKTVISTAGTTLSVSGNSLNWTLGEPISTKIASTDYKLTSGFQQGNIQMTTSVNFSQISTIEISPNPTAQYLTIREKSDQSVSYAFKIFDLTGRIVHRSKSAARETTIDVASFLAGSYILHIYSKDQLIQTTKFIKH